MIGVIKSPLYQNCYKDTEIGGGRRGRVESHQKQGSVESRCADLNQSH